MAEYDIRKGTSDNLGFDYEDQMVAYLAVAACNRKDLKDFWIANNVDGLGAWDDIVLYTETIKGEKILQFLQLKHIANPNKILQFKEYKDDIRKYAKNFENITSEINNQETQSKNIELLKRTEVRSEDMEFILMTNGEFNDNSTNFSKYSYCKNYFVMTNLDGAVYEISTSNAGYKVDFKKQFSIISEQSGVTNGCLLSNLVTELKIFISHTNFKHLLEIAKYLPTAIKDWFHAKEETLTATAVKQMISCSILSALKYIKPVGSTGPTLDEGKWDIFEKLIEPFQLVVLSNKPDLILENFFDKQMSYYIISCETADIKFVIDCIKVAKTIKVIMLAPHETVESITETEISTLSLLNSLPVESLARVNDVEIEIQGRKTILGSLLNKHSDIKNIFRVEEIVNLLLGKLSIGEDKHFLSYFVPRSIPRIFVEKSIILRMPNSFFIVIVKDNIVESELTIKSYLQSKLRNIETIKQTRSSQFNEKRFRFQCVKRDAVSAAISNFENQFCNVHVLKYYDNGEEFLLEWLSSSADVEQVKVFIENEKYDVKPIGDNLEDLFYSNISKILIVANPGMGKTYFLTYLANIYPVDSWVILVVLNEIDFNNIVNLQSYLEKFHTKKLSANDKKIFDMHLKNKLVVLLFDGFDEVAPDCNLEALNLIKEAIDEKLKVVVTSREVTKVILEKNLETIAFTLNPFSNNDKLNFLQHFYSQNIKQTDCVAMDVIDNRIKEFASNLLKNCSISNWDEEFTGVPLQCRLLAEGFIEEFQSYSMTDDLSKIPIKINLITLYENFIESKFNIYWKEKEGTVTKDLKSYERIIKPHRSVFISNHMDAAVQIVFPRVGNQISDEFAEEIKTANEKHGIITSLDGNNNPVFVHRTFAEYFAAMWLVEIKEGKKQFDELKRGEYLMFLLEAQFNVVRDLFDRMVCKQCELHNAVVNAELSKVRDILEKNGNRDEGKCGRNALHLISARGARHERIEKNYYVGKPFWVIERKEEEKYLEILDCLLENCENIDENEDSVLRWTPERYANERNAFGIVDTLSGFEGSQFYNFENTCMNKWNTEECLKMCARYDYVRLAEKIIENRELNSQDLTSMSYYSDRFVNESYNCTLLHVAAENGSLKILSLLLKYFDVNIKNNYGQTPLYAACNGGQFDKHLSVVKALVNNGGNVFLEKNVSNTPIDVAIGGENRETIEYLTSYDVLKIGFGEDINAALNVRSRTALHYAAMGKNMITLERLIFEGVNVKITDDEGNTVLHMIANARFYDADIARRFIEFGLDIDAQNSLGKTALYLAAHPGNIDYVKLLLHYGANPNIVDNYKLTPLNIARECGQDEIFLIFWDKTEQQLRNERDALHKFVLLEGENVEVRKRTFVGFPEELSHLADRMSEAGLYFYGEFDNVRCFSCHCRLYDWQPEDDPWAKHVERFEARNCEFLIQEKGRGFIERYNKFCGILMST